MHVEYEGIEADHKTWARFLGITEQTFRWRLKHWGLKRTVTTRKVAPSKRKAPRGRRDLTPEAVAAIHQLYLDGKSEDDIASIVGTSRSTISKLLKDSGVKFGGCRPQRITEAVNFQAARVVAKLDSVTISIDLATA